MKTLKMCDIGIIRFNSIVEALECPLISVCSTSKFYDFIVCIFLSRGKNTGGCVINLADFICVFPNISCIIRYSLYKT